MKISRSPRTLKSLQKSALSTSRMKYDHRRMLRVDPALFAELLSLAAGKK